MKDTELIALKRILRWKDTSQLRGCQVFRKSSTSVAPKIYSGYCVLWISCHRIHIHLVHVFREPVAGLLIQKACSVMFILTHQLVQALGHLRKSHRQPFDQCSDKL
jgi:hypothetical protein